MTYAIKNNAVRYARISVVQHCGGSLCGLKSQGFDFCMVQNKKAPLVMQAAGNFPKK